LGKKKDSAYMVHGIKYRAHQDVHLLFETFLNMPNS